MARIETLTAYKCKFSYLLRNNPLIEEQREAIKAGEDPEYSFSDFICTYQTYTENLAIGENTDRAIFLSAEKITESDKDGLKIWHLAPSAGKQGKPVTVVKKSGKKYDFDSSSAALYEYHIFVYENKEGLFAIFHRQNGSGCKSVFLETANKAIKSKGLKLEMDLIVPLTDGIKGATATKITLQFTKQNKSSDVADNIKSSKKKHIIRDLGLNLEVSENSKVLRIIKSMQSGKINQAEAFAQIKAEFRDSADYNDAEITLRVGNRHRKVPWNEFESIMGTHDISNALYEAYKISHDFVGELTKLAYEYYKEIIESEEV
jgi:hypothetical protein